MTPQQISALEVMAAQTLKGLSFPAQCNTIGCPWLHLTAGRLKLKNPKYFFLLLDWGSEEDDDPIFQNVSYLANARHNLPRAHDDKTTRKIFQNADICTLYDAGQCIIMNAIWGLRAGEKRQSNVPAARRYAGWQITAQVLQHFKPAVLVLMHSELQLGPRVHATFHPSFSTYDLHSAYRTGMNRPAAPAFSPSWVPSLGMDVSHPMNW